MIASPVATTTVSTTAKRINESIAIVCALRHGHALEKGKDQADRHRELSPEGIEQALGLMVALGELSDVDFNLRLTSPFVRAHQTLARANACTDSEMVHCDELGCSVDPDDELTVMFEEHVYRPLVSFHPTRRGYLQHALYPALCKWADGALERILNEAEAYKARTGEKAQLIIGGHAVVIPMLILTILKHLDADVPATVLFDNLGNAEAHLLQITDGRVGFKHIKPVMTADARN